VPHDEKPLVWQVAPLQQPVGQLVPSHTHCPPEQRCPAPQGAFCPHWQVPFAAQVSAFVASQIAHIWPRAPQLDGDCTWQLSVASQQPLAQLCGVQTHWPFSQACPSAQAGPLPQRQPPWATAQASARPAGQLSHSAPGAPQAMKSAAMQVLPALQQPFGQLVASHTHCPPTQRCPLSHPGPTPQRQTPSGPQLSVAVGSQVPQAPPAGPQALVERGVH